MLVVFRENTACCYTWTIAGAVILKHWMKMKWPLVVFKNWIIQKTLLLTDWGGWPGEDCGCQVQNIWLWLRYRLQLFGYWVGERQICEWTHYKHLGVGYALLFMFLFILLCSFLMIDWNGFCGYWSFALFFPGGRSSDDKEHWHCQRAQSSTSQTSLL